MSIYIHSDARDHYNRVGQDLIAKLFSGDAAIKHIGMDIEDHGLLPGYVSDPQFGLLVDEGFMPRGIFHKHKTDSIALLDDDYACFQRLCSEIQRHEGVSRFLSNEFIRVHALEWLAKHYSGSCTNDLCSYLLGQAYKEIAEYDILIPIANTKIEREFRMGCVRFRPITDELIDQGKATMSIASHDSSGQFREYRLNLLESVRGLAGACVSAHGEPRRCAEIAFGSVQSALSILRLLSIGSTNPSIRSYSVPIGSTTEHLQAFTLQDGNITGLFHRPADEQLTWWTIREDLIVCIEQISDHIDRLIGENYRNGDEHFIMKSISLFDRSVMTRNAAEKLVAVIGALEFTLLEREGSVAQTVAERIALFIGNSADERKTIDQTYKKFYNYRSDAVHRSEAISNPETLNPFMHLARNFFLLLLLNSSTYKTKSALIDDLKTQKYTLPGDKDPNLPNKQTETDYVI